ncbi:MAG: PASTA domain-containing protein, partial [Phycisphaerae bacterium]
MQFKKGKSALISLILLLGLLVCQSLGRNFSIIVLPDTQYYSQSYPSTFSAQTQWIVNNKNTFNVAAVLHEGDIVNVASNTTQWNNADAAMSLLEDPVTTGLADGIPYGVCPGNHDIPTTNYNLYFGVSRFSGRSYYGGNYGTTNDSNYILFTAEGVKFIVVFLTYSPSSDVISWANGIIAANSDRRAIVVSHDILTAAGVFSTAGQAIYNGLKENPNLFLILCGHIHTEARRTDTYNGNTVHTLLADYQDEPNGGNGWLRILEFSPTSNEIFVSTYSPTLGQYKTAASSEFTLNAELPSEHTIDFTAYNDLAWGTGQLNTNITRITSPSGTSGLPSSGALVDYNTAEAADVILTVTGGTFSSSFATLGAEPASGTDAYNIFNGKVSSTGGIHYIDSAPPAGNLVLTLSNMNPDKTYNIAFYGNRNDYTWDRASLVTISGADYFTNKSSVGLDNNNNPLFSGPDDDSTRIPSDNTATGYVAYFADVECGSDGEVVLTISFDGVAASQYKSKYASALMVQQYNGSVPPPSTGWTAYNDCAWASGQLQNNITTYTIPSNGTASGLLKNYATGTNLGVTATLTVSGSPQVQTGTYGGSETNSGTDAYNTFHDFVSVPGVIQYGSSGWWVDITFTGLDPSKTYTFAATGNRNDSGYTTRIARFTLSGDEGAVNASTSGVDVISNNSVYFCTGYNTVNGYVARWTNIKPGSDGSFVVRVQEQTSGNKAYGPSVFMLQEEAEQQPEIVITGTPLSEFESETGTPSDAQSYTVSGSNLIDDIVITAPSDFEISLTSGSGFGSSLVLPKSGGAVANTTIYVRFNRNTEGASEGDILHSSDGVSSQNVQVSGIAVNPPCGWIAYNDCSGTTGGNTTAYTITSGSTTGLLKNYDTGENTSVTVTFSSSGSPAVSTTYGAATNSGTDAYNTFNGFANMVGLVNYGNSGYWVDINFTGLNPTKTYTFATTANRNDASYTTRISRFTLSGVDAAANASTSGVNVINNHSVYFCTGYNTVNGYVARWTGINPGSDGSFVVRVQEQEANNKGYGPSVFMLQEECSSCMSTVPNVVGQSESDAETALIAVGLVKGDVTTASSETVSLGDVISQDPAADSSVPCGSAVALVISSGPCMATVPNVVGMTEANAETALTAVGLVKGDVTTASSETVSLGDVISQDPAADSSVPCGSAVALVISSGP